MKNYTKTSSTNVGGVESKKKNLFCGGVIRIKKHCIFFEEIDVFVEA